MNESNYNILRMNESNEYKFWVRDTPIVYRVDGRDPVELVENGGFGGSQVSGHGYKGFEIGPLVDPPATMGSGDIVSSNRYFDWLENEKYSRYSSDSGDSIKSNNLSDESASGDDYDVDMKDMNPNQYAVLTAGTDTVGASDNPFMDINEYNEVHFKADIPVDRIYIIDSKDPNVREAIAEIIASPYVSTQYGVPINAYVDYMEGRLNINDPNNAYRVPVN